MPSHSFGASVPSSTPAKLPGTMHALLGALTEGSVTPAVLLESLYYAADESLLALVRIVAALDETARAKVLDFASSLYGDDVALTLLLDLPPRPPRHGPAGAGTDALADCGRG